MPSEEMLQSESWSRWVEWGAGELSFLGNRQARRECERVLETLFGLHRSEIYLSQVALPKGFSRFSELVQARKKRIPLAYLLGRTPFWDAELEIDSGVFIPRPETEILIESFVKMSGFRTDSCFRFLDLGTGSGNIAVTVAKLFPKTQGVGSDLSSQALAAARNNACQLAVSCRIQWIQAPGLDAFNQGSFDVIFSNPPYINSGECEGLEPEVQQEPRLALDGGPDGMALYRHLLENISSLRLGGSLWVEIGWDQGERVVTLFENRFERTQLFQDLNGLDRIVGAAGFHG